MDTNMNIPIGAHDIYTEEDLLIALTRLISSNLSISRWILRLNVDYNNESTVVLDTARLPLVASLKIEQQMLMASSGNDTESWYERHVQLNARKRILHQLKELGLSEVLTICRDDIYPTWSGHYVRFLTQIGVVIEAEPPLLLGRIESCCFISPLGGLYVQQSSQILSDEFYQKQGVVFPQSLIHPKSVEGASKAIGLKLYDNYGATGYFTVSYLVYRDAYDNITRLWATGLRFGLNPSYCAIATLAQLTNPFGSKLLSECPLVPPVVEGLPSLASPALSRLTIRLLGRCCVYLPTAIHPPLSSSRDDVFFKLCKLNGISYDAQRKTGVLFFMVDGLVGASPPSLVHSRSLSVSLSLLTSLEQVGC
jgi:IQ domain-containing protein H